jgi:hypothetical protein
MSTTELRIFFRAVMIIVVVLLIIRLITGKNHPAVLYDWMK